MAITTATVTIPDLHDYVGADFDVRRTKVFVTTNVDGESIFDTDTGELWQGGGSVALSGSTATITVPTPGDSNPASWQTTIHLDYPDAGTRARKVRSFGPFTITEDANLADLVTEQEVPPEYLTTVTTLLDGYVDDAEAAAAEAAASAAEAELITGLTGEDEAVAALIPLGGATTDALSASFAPVLTPEKFGAVGDGATDDTAAVVACFAAANALKRLTAPYGSNVYAPGATVRLGGVYKLTGLSGPLVAMCNLDGREGTLLAPTSYAGTVLLLGHDTSGALVNGAFQNAPVVSKYGTVASMVAGSVGVQIQNGYGCHIRLNRTTYFETGIWLTGYGTGTAYNTIHFGWVDLCKVDLRIASRTGGWFNQNVVIGGEFAQSPNTFDGGSTSDKRRAGWRHLVMDGSAGAAGTVDGITFVGCSFEGLLSEYQFDISHSADISWVGTTRFETSDLGTAVAVSGDTLTMGSAHNLAVGDMVDFVVTGSRPGGLISGAGNYGRPGYYVTAVPSSTTFKVAETRGGPTVTFTSAGSGVLVVYPARLNFHDGAVRMTMGRFLTWTGPLDIRQDSTCRDIVIPPILGIHGDLMPGRNRIANGNFRTNQRQYASGTFASSGTFAFDRWKSTQNGSSMTFTAGPQGQPVTVGGQFAQTIPQGDLEPGQYTLSWRGYVTFRAYRVGDTPGSFASGPITFDCDGTTDLVVEMSGGSEQCSLVQLERGANATPFEAVPVAVELARCKRYFQRIGSLSGSQVRETFGVGVALTTTSAVFGYTLPVEMRTTPTLAINGAAVSTLRVNDANSLATVSACVLAGSAGSQSTPKALRIAVTTGATLTAGHAVFGDTGDSNACLDLSAEL